MRYSDFLPDRDDGLFPPEAAPGVPLSEYDYDRLLVYYRPDGPSVNIARRQIDDLQESKYAHKVDIRETSPHGAEANQELFANTLQEGDILVLVTGDGTANLAIQALTNQYLISKESLRRTPILPLGGGYANDLDVMLNDSRHRIAPSDIIEHGRVVGFRPIKATMTATDGVGRTRHAGAYISLGASAQSAWDINQPAHRSSRLQKIPGVKDLHKGAAIARSLYGASMFKLEQEGDERETYELIFANGWRMAKGVLHFSQRLTDRGVYWCEVGGKDFTTLSCTVGQLLLRNLRGHTVDGATEFTIRTSTFIQFDGEAERIPYGTGISIGPADIALNAVTTRVRP